MCGMEGVEGSGGGPPGVSQRSGLGEVFVPDDFTLKKDSLAQNRLFSVYCSPAEKKANMSTEHNDEIHEP